MSRPTSWAKLFYLQESLPVESWPVRLWPLLRGSLCTLRLRQRCIVLVSIRLTTPLVQALDYSTDVLGL